ncbi:MAG: pirin family protein [Steroidobacteraceae bacterium]
MNAQISTPGSIRPLLQRVRGQATSDGDGVKLSRVIGTRELPDLDPFLLLDEFGSEEASDYIGGFPAHPHRGFETVTYMLEGRMRHRDNHGNEGLLQPGSVQWMTAGRGIVHSEMPEQEQGRMRGFQLWVNLPARAKMMAPRYQDIAPESIPLVSDPASGAQVRVVAGEFNGVTGPVQDIVTAPTYLDVTLPAGALFQRALPVAHTVFIMLFEGSARVGASAELLTASELGVLGSGERTEVQAGAQGARFLVVAAQPLREPVARYGPFVMNTREEIIRAVEDYNAGRF